MFRALVRLVVLVVVLAAAAAFFFGYRWGDATAGRTAEPVGTSGTATERTERAREAGAEIGEQVATGVERAGAALDEGRLTAKVKSKIALDDTLDGVSISVETENDVVTVAGGVSSEAQRRRVLQLAQETEGVSRVVDRLTVR